MITLGCQRMGQDGWLRESALNGMAVINPVCRITSETGSAPVVAMRVFVSSSSRRPPRRRSGTNSDHAAFGDLHATSTDGNRKSITNYWIGRSLAVGRASAIRPS